MRTSLPETVIIAGGVRIVDMVWIWEVYWLGDKCRIIAVTDIFAELAKSLRGFIATDNL
jgi:hypothetical protein